MRINLTSVFVDDQVKALKFYTEVLGFIKKTEVLLTFGASLDSYIGHFDSVFRAFFT